VGGEAAEQGDEADEAFGGTVTRQKCRLMPAPVNFGSGHRFAAYPRCSADLARAAHGEENRVSEKSVAQKAHVKPGTTIRLVNRVLGLVESLGLPNDVAFVKSPKAALVFVFVRTEAELRSKMPAAVDQVGPAAAIWVFFQKGSKGAGLDMNRDTVWAVAEKLGLRPLGLLSVDDTWSAFRFRRAQTGVGAASRPKAGGRGRRTRG
jgi:hypothetical protein